MYFLLLLALKLLDFLMIALAIIAGGVSRSWWHVAGGALVVAAIVEMVLSSLQQMRTFEPVEFAIGYLAAFAWASLIFYIKQRLAARKASKTPGS